MFFFTYLRRELRSRMRQAVFIALGLALGVGLVVTVAAASSGVNQAQASVLGALYGVGTDVTVTGPVPGPIQGGHAQNLTIGPNGPELCTNGKCHSLAGQTTSNVLPSYSAISEPKVAQVAHLRGVRAAVGVLSVGILSATFPKAGSNGVPQVSSISVDGIDTGHLSVGPLSSATLTSGHAFTAADSNSAVAVVDSGYAKSSRLKVGSALAIAQVKCTVIGIVRQPQQGGSPTDVYIPLARVQAIPTPSGTQKNDVNTIYVSAASAADISAVQREISGLLPGTTVTTASSVAKEVTGAISGASKLANDLGRWLSVLVLIAAFVVAILLTMAAVARRAREFGTLKAIGWRSRRIIAQVLGESAVTGIAGAAAGIGLGYAGTAIIAAIAPKLSASVPLNNGAGVARTEQVGPGALSGGFSSLGGPTAHVVSVPLHPSVSAGVIALAVILAVAGGLLAGGVGSWRIAGLRPADALARVA